MMCDVDLQIADIMRRCHIIQQWMRTYQEYLPAHVILFFNRLFLHIGLQILTTARTIQAVTGINYLN